MHELVLGMLVKLIYFFAIIMASTNLYYTAHLMGIFSMSMNLYRMFDRNFQHSSIIHDFSSKVII